MALSSISPRDQLLGQLMQIRTDLMTSSVKDETGLYWRSPYYESETRYSFKTTVDIFNGNSGIALFFMGLFESGGKKEDLRIAEEIMNKVLSSDDVLKPRAFGFYTGLTGVVYACVKLYELNQKKQYLLKAHELILENKQAIIEHLVKADLLSGYAGVLFVTTLLYHHGRDKNVLVIIRQLIQRLIHEARISEAGLKWDYNQSKSGFDSLAGFSHGASGIAYVLLQVGHYFKSEGLIYLAEQALEYEMQYYHQESENWLDLRLGSYRLGLPDVHRWDLNLFLPEMKKVNSWAHGAAGIGLARLYAYQLTGKKIYLDQCHQVMSKCLKELKKLDRTDFTWCSGYMGMFPFLSAFQEFAHADFTSLFLSVAIKAGKTAKLKHSYNTYISASQFDYGLLSGKSGIGYMLLNIVDQEIGSVAFPHLPPNSDLVADLVCPDRRSLQNQIFLAHYPQTIQLLDQLEPGCSVQLNAENINEFEVCLREKINSLTMPGIPELMGVFDFEYQVTACWKLHKGHVCYVKKNEYIRSNAKELSIASETDLLRMKLGLNDHIVFYRLSSEFREILKIELKHQAVLLIAEESGISQVYIGQLSTLVLGYLEMNPSDIAGMINLVLQDYNEKEKAGQELLRDKVILQIRSLLVSGIIGLKQNPLKRET